MVFSELPPFELDPSAPLQIQIHRQLVEWILEGRLQAGARLPSTRRLSHQLGVSRNTVVAVIDQLKAEGFVSSEVGRGSFIESSLPRLQRPEIKQDLSGEETLPLSDFAQSVTQLNVNRHKHILPFTPGIPCLDAFPHSIWQTLWRRHHSRTALMSYDNLQGHEPLRNAIVDYLRVSRGVRCTAEQILITQGTQQAISLCALMLLNDGDTVLHENPGYRGAQAAFAIRQPKQIAVPLKDQAINVTWLQANADQTASAKLLYTTPTHQYPMGGLLSASDRIALIQWAKDNQVWILEDDYDSEFHFSHAPVAAMQGITHNNHVIYMGSFSKVLFPSLRLGYLVLPKPLVEAFTIAKSTMTGRSSLIVQGVIADFIQEGHFARHLRRMRQLYKKKWQSLDELLRTELGDRIEIIADSAGMHLTIGIPDCDDQKLVQHLNQKGFGGAPLSTFYLGQPEKQGLVLGFSNVSVEQQISLVTVLREYLRG